MSRSRLKVRPIDPEEWRSGIADMSPVVERPGSLVGGPSATPPAFGTLPVSGGPEKGGPFAGPGGDDGQTRIKTAASPDAHSRQEVEKGPPISGAPFSTSDPSIEATVYRRQPRIERAKRVQDGHSLGEDKLYHALLSACPRDRNPKVITIGLKGMQDLCKMTINNCRANIKSLIRKLAIEEIHDHTAVTGRTYLIHDYNTILQRRAAAGMTHVIRTRGVVFVDEQTGKPITPTTTSFRQKGAVEKGGPLSVAPYRGLPHEAQRGHPLSGGLSIKEKSSNDPSSTTAPDALRRSIQTQLPECDDAAVNYIWDCCVKSVPDVSWIEVAALFRLRLSQHSQQGNIKNMVGLLKTSVPQLCTEARISAMRQGTDAPIISFGPRAACEIITAGTEPQIQSDWRATLNDPNATEHERKLANLLRDQKTS